MVFLPPLPGQHRRALGCSWPCGVLAWGTAAVRVDSPAYVRTARMSPWRAPARAIFGQHTTGLFAVLQQDVQQPSQGTEVRGPHDVSSADFGILAERFAGRATQLRTETHRQVHDADAPMIGAFPSHGVDASIEVLVALLLSALQGEVLVDG